MKRIKIECTLLHDVVSFPGQRVPYLVYRVFCDGAYLGDCRSEREICIFVSGLTAGLLEKDYIIEVGEQ